MSSTGDKLSNVEIGQSGMNKAAENISERAIDIVLNLIKNKYGKACVAIGYAFKLYLKNSEIRYNQIKTLADLAEPRILEGPEGIYVDVFIKHKKKKIAVRTVENLINISNNIVIIGSGGTGKSMLMRHLFVNTHHIGKYIPVLVELRKITNTKDEHALLNLIHACMESFDVTLNQEQFEYSLRAGKYLFLFDGLDEVKEELRGEVEQLIQELSKKYPDNSYIVSSREDGVSFSELETYTLVNACPFEKYQAIELVKKLGGNNEKILEFANLLDKELYKKHEDFASNPLLLTMMYITFMDNNMIPEHLTDFYENAYDALYKRHDANKEGLFKRDYKCKKLGEREFKDLFAYFCFQSYFLQEYEFSKEEVCQYISQGIIKLKFEELIKNPEMFFDDIKDIVCLMVEEGTKYKFAHRSFQTYFAAYYMVAHITDEQQKIFMGKELRRQFGMKADFFFILYRLEEERFDTNILEPGIECILAKLEGKGDIRFGLLNIICQAIAFQKDEVFLLMNSSKHMKIPYERNIAMLFEDLVCKDKSSDKIVKDKLINLLRKQEAIVNNDDVEIDELLKIEPINERIEIFELLYEYLEVDYLYEQMILWMKRQKDKREQIEDNRGRKELLSLL